MIVVHPKENEGLRLVIVVGGGFAGLNVAKALGNQAGVYVILVDQRNHHLFQPLLYQVATAGLNPSDIAVPIRAQFSNMKNVEVHCSKVKAVDLLKKAIQLDDFWLHYDDLVLACGARHSYFSHPEWEEFAPGLKTLVEATEIRRRILLAFEHAENAVDSKVQNELLNFVIVGGGPTGVELAGAIADISRTVLVEDFRRIDPARAKVILVEAGPRLLASFAESLSDRTVKDLTELGVEVRTNSRVENINANGVFVGNEFIPSKAVFWAAGVQATKMKIEPTVEMDRAGRVKVSADLSIPNFPHTFVIGDMAAVEVSPGQIVPGLAPAAIQEGKHVASVIVASIHNRQRKPFLYRDKGQMATIGKRRAIAQTGNWKMTGLLAWFAWLFVHLFFLVGFKNRVSVLVQWAWSYVFSKRGARLITEPSWRNEKVLQSESLAPRPNSNPST